MPTIPISIQPIHPSKSANAAGAIAIPITITHNTSADRRVNVDAVAASSEVELLLIMLTTRKGSPSRKGRTWFAPSERWMPARL